MFSILKQHLKTPCENSHRAAWFLSSVSLAGMCAILLAIPYSYGVGTFRFSLAQLLWQVWMRNEEMQHGVLVVPACALVIWFRRGLFRGISPSGSWMGIPILLFGLFVYHTGYRADIFTAGQAGLWISIVGATLWLFGWPAFRILAFPIGFLLFAFPIPGIDTMVTFPLRMVMSHASVAVLNGLGIDVVLQGTGILSAPDLLLGLPAGKKFSVDIADPCSGIRSLLALMMVSALYAQFALKTWWQKWILFLCSIPLAIAGNLVRILTLTLGTIAFGAQFAIGKNALTEPSWFHTASGYMVFAVAIGGMIGITWLLDGGETGPVARIRRFAEKCTARAQLPAAPGTTSVPDGPKPKQRDLY